MINNNSRDFLFLLFLHFGTLPPIFLLSNLRFLHPLSFLILSIIYLLFLRTTFCNCNQNHHENNNNNNYNSNYHSYLIKLTTLYLLVHRLVKSSIVLRYVVYWHCIVHFATFSLLCAGCIAKYFDSLFEVVENYVPVCHPVCSQNVSVQRVYSQADLCTSHPLKNEIFCRTPTYNPTWNHNVDWGKYLYYHLFQSLVPFLYLETNVGFLRNQAFILWAVFAAGIFKRSCQISKICCWKIAECWARINENPVTASILSLLFNHVRAHPNLPHLLQTIQIVTGIVGGYYRVAT